MKRASFWLLVGLMNISCAAMPVEEGGLKRKREGEVVANSSIIEPAKRPKIGGFELHDLEQEHQKKEENRCFLIKSLAQLKERKIQMALEQLKASNPVMQRKGAYNIVMNLSDRREEECAAKSITLFFDQFSIKQIENSSAEYFAEKFTSLSNLRFAKKNAGVQLGCKVIFTIEEKERIFWVKTHSRGTLNSTEGRSTASKPLDPKELLVYKVLEKLELGPEVHFFGPDINNYYIATADLNATGIFEEHHKIADDEVSMLQHNKICDELIKGDVISRIFCLRDTILNTGNFGFIDKRQLKMLDFRFEEQDSFVMQDIFSGFLTSNGRYKYQDSTDYLIQFALVKREKAERVSLAKEFLLSSSLKIVVEETKAFILEILSDNFKKEIESYFSDVLKNLEQFEIGVKNYDRS